MEAVEGLTKEELKAVREIRNELDDVLTRYGKLIGSKFARKPVGFVYGFAYPNAKGGVQGVRMMRAGNDYVTSGIIYSMLKEMPDISRGAVRAYNETDRMNINIASLADPTAS